MLFCAHADAIFTKAVVQKQTQQNHFTTEGTEKSFLLLTTPVQKQRQELFTTEDTDDTEKRFLLLAALVSESKKADSDT